MSLPSSYPYISPRLTPRLHPMSECKMSQGPRKRPRSSYASGASAASASSAAGPARRKRVSVLPEKKCVDSGAIGAAFSTTLSNSLLFNPVLGDDVIHRDGRICMVKSIHLTGQVYMNGDVDASNIDYLRLMVVYDKQTNGAFPVIADVLSSVAPNGGVLSTARSHLNISNSDRFQVLVDKRWAMHATPANTLTTAATTSFQGHPTSQPFEINEYRRGSWPVKFSASAGAITDIVSGGIYLLLVGLNTAATAQFSFEGSARCRFLDTK